MMKCQVLLCGLLSLSLNRTFGEDADVPINLFPFIMAHDAGSGYLNQFDRGVEELVVKWTQTQPGGLGAQLNCGARAFDSRPKVDKEGVLVWHHGPITVNHTFSASIEEVVSWCSQNPAELVVMTIWDCEGVDCMNKVTATLEAAGVSPVTECETFVNLTVGEARRISLLPTGGHLLAVIAPATPGGEDACSYSNYLPTNACSGVNESCISSLLTPQSSMLDVIAVGKLISAHNSSLCDHNLESDKIYRCYDGDSTALFPINRMFEYLDNTSSSFSTPSSAALNGQLWQMQALWQESSASVVLGTLARSSLIDDEARSSLNMKIAEAVSQGRWKYINLLEVNNVCDGGLALANALSEWWASSGRNEALLSKITEAS